MDRTSKLGVTIAALSVLHLVAVYLLNESPVWANASELLAVKLQPLLGALPKLLLAFVFAGMGLAIAAAIGERESRVAAGIFLAVSLFEFWARLRQMGAVLEYGIEPDGVLLLGVVVSLIALIVAAIALWTTIRRV